MEASAAKFPAVAGIITRPPPLPLPGSARLVLGANKCDGNVRPLRTFVASFSLGFSGLNGCTASAASTRITAECVRRDIPCARLECADLSKCKRCNGAPFGTHFPLPPSQGIMKVSADPLNYVVARTHRGKQGTHEGFAHGQASAPASNLDALLDEAGCERVLRSTARQIGCPQKVHLVIPQ